MACLPTTQECEQKDTDDRSPPQSSLCNQTSDMNPAHNYPTLSQEACKVEYTVKESLSETPDITAEKTPEHTNALQANHKKDQQEVVSQQEEVISEVISEEENPEAKQYQCRTEKVIDKEAELVEFADASIPTIDGTGYLPEGHTAHGGTDSVSTKGLTQEESIACVYQNRDMRLENDVITSVDQQEKDDNVHVDEQNTHAAGLREGCHSQEYTTAHASVTFATPLEEYFEYAVSPNPADQTSEPTLECGSTDWETSMYDVDENKFPDWKIPSSFDVALCKRNYIDESIENGHNHVTIEECLKGNDIEDKLKEEFESERSLIDDAFPSFVYRAPSELLDVNIDDDITGTAIKRCIDNNEKWTYGGSQEEQISSNMNCYGVSSSPTKSTKLAGNDKGLLHPEVKQVIASVVQQVMAAMSTDEDVIMQQGYQRDADFPHSSTNKGANEKQLNSLCSENYNTEEASEKSTDLSPNAATDTATEHLASPIPQEDHVSECPKQESGQTAVSEAIVSSSQEQGYIHCSQVRNASTPQHQLHIHRSGDIVIELEDIECRCEPLRRDYGKFDVEELQRDGRQENQEQLSPNSTTAGTSVKVKNNDKVVPKLEQADVLLSQEDRMKDRIETHERDLAGVVFPVKNMEVEGTCVPDGDIDSSQTPVNCFTSQNASKSPEESSQLLGTDGDVNSGKPKEIQCDSELGLNKHIEHTENQISGFPKQESGQTEMKDIACESVPREPHILDVEVLHTDYEEISPGLTRGDEANMDKNYDKVVPKTKILDLLLSQEDMFENDPDDYSRAPSMEDDVQKYSMKNKVETHQRDRGGVVSPVKYRNLEGTYVSDGNTDTPKTPFYSFSGQKSPQNGSQLPVTDTDRDSIDRRSDIVTKNLQDHLQTGAHRNSMKSCVETITPIDQANRQDMHPKDGSQEGGGGKNSRTLSGGSLCSSSSGHGEAISQTHVPVSHDNNGSPSDTSERHDQSQSHQSGDNVIGMDNIPCRNNPPKGSGEPEPLDIEVLHKVVSQENHEEKSSDSTTAQTAGKNIDRMVPNTDKVDDLLSQEDMFENEPNDASVALVMKDDIQNYSPGKKAEIYDEKRLADVVCPVNQMERESKDAASRDMDSSQTLFHSFPSPNSSPPPSITHRKPSDAGSQLLPVSNTKVDSGKTDAKYVNTKVDSGKTDVNYVNTKVDSGKTDANYVNTKVDSGKTDANYVNTKVDSGKTDANYVNTKVDSGKTDVNYVNTKVDSGKTDANYVNTKVDSGKTDANYVNTKVDSGKTDAKYDSESGLKTETQPDPETPYSVTDSPYIGNTGRDITDQAKDIVRQYPQDHPQGNAFGNYHVTSYVDQAYRENMHSNNGGQDDCEKSGILSGESKDGNVCSHISGGSAVLSQTHVSSLEGVPALEEAFDYSTSNTSEHHDVSKAQQEITLLTPTPREEFEGNETGIESPKSIKLEPTDIELLVEEIIQKLDLTLEHLSPIPPQNYSVDDYNPPPFDPLQSEFVKVSVVRSQSQSSIICLQSLHDNIPDSETDETDTRSKPSSQRHSLKRRSAYQDLYIPTKTQRSESTYPVSQPPDVSDPEDSTDGGGKGEAASVGLAHIQPPTGKANDAVRISCHSPLKDCTVPDSDLMGTKQQLEGSHQWREDQAVPGNIEEFVVVTTRQCHLVEQDALSLYDDRTADSKRGAPYEFINKHNEKTAQRLEKFQQFPPVSATDTSPSNSSEDSVRSSSPRPHDHHTVPGSPRSSFRWRYAPSVDFDSVSVVHENMVDEDASLETCRPLPLVTCRRPLRVGLSRRHRAPPLHPNFRPPRRLHDV